METKEFGNGFKTVAVLLQVVCLMIGIRSVSAFLLNRSSDLMTSGITIPFFILTFIWSASRKK